MKPKTGRMFYKGQNLSFEMRCSFIPGDNSTAFNDDDQVVSISMRYLPNEDGDGFVDIDGLSFVPAVKEHLISALNVKRGSSCWSARRTPVSQRLWPRFWDSTISSSATR